LRDLAGMTAEARDKFSPKHIPAAAKRGLDGALPVRSLAGLSDSRIGSLLRGDPVEISAAPLRDALASELASLRSRHAPDSPQRGSYPDASSITGLTLRVTPLDPALVKPASGAAYTLGVTARGADGSTIPMEGLILNWDGYSEGRGEGLLPESPPRPDEPVYDLSPLLAEGKATPEERCDLGFVLAALAKTAGARVYQEHFLKYGSSQYRMPILRGTVPQLLNAACRTWGYRVEPAGGGSFLLWPRSWAFDRDADIPEHELSPWRRRFQSREAATALDDMDAATAFTLPQLQATLSIAIEPMRSLERWAAGNHLSARVVAAMTPQQREAAVSAATPRGNSRGVPLSRLAPGSLAALRSVLEQGENGLRPDDRVLLLPGGRGRSAFDPITLSVVAEDGRMVWAAPTVVRD